MWMAGIDDDDGDDDDGRVESAIGRRPKSSVQWFGFHSSSKCHVFISHAREPCSGRVGPLRMLGNRLL